MKSLQILPQDTEQVIPTGSRDPGALRTSDTNSLSGSKRKHGEDDFDTGSEDDRKTISIARPQPASGKQRVPGSSSIDPQKTNKPRPYSCVTCGRSFSRSEHLSRHERSHNKEKPFECPTCGRCFARRDLLHQHQRLHQLPSTPNDAFRQSALQFLNAPSTTVAMSSAPETLWRGSDVNEYQRPLGDTVYAWSQLEGTPAPHLNERARESGGADNVLRQMPDQWYFTPRNGPCLRCRVRKSGCDFNVPCTHCLHFGTPCEYMSPHDLRNDRPRDSSQQREMAYCVVCRRWNNTCSCSSEFMLGRSPSFAQRGSRSASVSSNEGDHRDSAPLTKTPSLADTLKRMSRRYSMTDELTSGSRSYSEPGITANENEPSRIVSERASDSGKRSRSDSDESWDGC